MMRAPLKTGAIVIGGGVSQLMLRGNGKPGGHAVVFSSPSAAIRQGGV